MQSVTGQDVLNFYNARNDWLVLTERGELECMKSVDGTTPYGMTRVDGREVQVLLDLATLHREDRPPHFFDQSGRLKPEAAEGLAQDIMKFGVLPGRAVKARIAVARWKQAADEAERCAAEQVRAVQELVKYSDIKKAAQLLNLEKRAVIRLLADPGDAPRSPRMVRT
ncbi:hypothetical protein AB0M58_43275 [Streptomyces bobili]|uniref:hypothetical protein n=1 Tax=Streptomyces bobili TaxID=67280 RepID=UPI0034170790